jgi:hypothetical protein
MTYTYEILNAASTAGQSPELEVQTRVFHEGAQVIADKIALNASAGLQDPQHLRAAGRLAIGREMTPGAYVLQVIVTDKFAKNKFNVAAQSVDFEIEE